VHPGEPMPAGPVPSVLGDLRLVGFEELSATAVRDRVLARRAEFWSGSALTGQAVVGLHDPLFFHQLGGFGSAGSGPSR
jgi:hypothetical protein